MALSQSTYRVQFAGGIETKMSADSVPTVRLLALENAVFTRAVSLSKRFGYESLGLTILGSSAPYALPRGLAARGDEVILFTEASAYSHVSGAAAWSTIADGAASIRAAERDLVKVVASQTGCDRAVCSGIALVAWDDSRGGVWFAVTEAENDRVTIAPTQASATGSLPRAIRCGAKLMLLWAEAALGQIKVIVIDPAVPNGYDTTEFPHAIVDDLRTTLPTFDAAYCADTNDIGVAAGALTWNASSGVRAAWLDPSGVVGSPGMGWPGAITIVPAAAVCAGPTIAPSADRSNFWPIAWTTGTKDVYGTIVYSDPSSPVDPASTLFAPVATGAAPDPITRMAIGCRDTGSVITADVWCEERETIVRNSFVSHATLSQAGAWTSGTPALFRGMCLASQGWTDAPAGGTQRGYVNLLHSAPLYSAYFAVRDDGLVVAQSVPASAGLPPGRQLPRVTADGDRAVQWCAVYRAKLGATGDDVFAEAGPRLVTLDFDADDAHQTAQIGRTLYLGGAVTMAYDGLGFVEALPMIAPDWETGAVLHTAGSGGGLGVGTYSYVAWYEGTLANGEIARGPASKPYSVTVTGGANDRVTFGWPTLRIGAWGRSGGARENCRLCVARSVAGDASAYYRIASLDPSTAGADNGYVPNTQSADTAAFVDVLPDAVVRTREPHYTTDGIPGNDPLATSGVIAECGGRLFVGDAADRNRLFFSQEPAEGYSIEFTPALRIAAPLAGGEVTGIGDLDGSKIIFKRAAIYILAGPGPVPTGVEGAWGVPVLVTGDVGCIDQRSIVKTPVGLMFQSAKGIYLIDRGRNVTYVGAPVESFNALRVARATLIEDANQVRFLTAGVTLLYDYLFQQWSTFTNHEGIDAINAGALYHYLRTDGRVFRQTATYADANLQIPLVIETAWIRLGEARQGSQRIWHAQILGTWKSAHRLSVQYQIDYDEPGNWSEPVPFDATAPGGDNYGAGNYGAGNYGGSTPARYQWKFHIGRKCQAIRFRLRFIEAPGAFGACAEVTELLLTGGVKGALNKLPAARMA